MDQVKTRFAPSPTGNPHIGNIRTALYNYLFAHQNGGKFLLRVEDTDKSREVVGSIEGIEKSLSWLGIPFDEKPVLQSNNFEIHRKYAKELVETGLAYEQEGAIYFKVPTDGETSWIDLIGEKKISFENKDQKDFVILRSNNIPVYHLAAIVDDHLMEITHVIRGTDWVSSTPKHIMLYQALGWEIPKFAHVPMILASDRSKLSKRHGAVGIFDFQKEGYLPEALINYIALLGWTPPSGKESLSLQEMVNEFRLEEVHVAPAVFDYQKLDWMNGEYIRKTENSNLKTQIYQYLRDLSGDALTSKDHPTEEEIEKVIPLIKDRIKKLSDFVPLTDFLWEKPEYDKSVFIKLKLGNYQPVEVLEKILAKLEAMKSPWESKTFEETFRKLAQDLTIPAGGIFQLIRAAISGQLVTPPLFESIEILGEKEALDRIKSVISNYPSLPNALS